MDDADPGDAVPESGVRLEKGAVSRGRAWTGAGVCTGGRGTRAAGSSLFCVQGLSQSRWTGQQPGSVYWIKHSREDDSWLLKVQLPLVVPPCHPCHALGLEQFSGDMSPCDPLGLVEVALLSAVTYL